MKKIGVRQVGVNLGSMRAINRKIDPGGAVSGGSCCGCDPGPYGHNPQIGSVCTHVCGTLSGQKAKPGDLVSNPVRRMNIAKVQRRVR